MTVRLSFDAVPASAFSTPRALAGERIVGQTVRRYTANMSTKELAIRSLEELPEDADWDDVQERINFLVGVRRGLRELDEGKGIPHDRVREEFAQWLTN